MNIEDLKKGFEKIGYELSESANSCRNAFDQNGVELNFVLWFDNQIEIEIGDHQKIIMNLEKCEIGISNSKTLSIGAPDKSVYFQFYNYDFKKTK